MSWLFGFTGLKLSNEQTAKFSAIHSQPLFSYRSDKIYLSAGGNPATCLFDSDSAVVRDSPDTRWLALGMGILQHDNHRRVMSAADWANRLKHDDPHFNALDGHFVVLRWQSESIECYTDQLGLRSLYFLHSDGGTAFSTRADWLSQLQTSPKINFEVFGAQWLTVNQFSHESTIQGLHRSAPGSRVYITPQSFTARSVPWQPSRPDGGYTSFVDFARSMTSIYPPTGHNIALGLSGGLDSRAVLALLSRSPNTEYSSYVFGADSHADVRVSRNIAARERLQHEHFNDVLPSADICRQMLSDFVANSGVIQPASAILSMRYYTQLAAQKAFIIDGGFGEIVRRQFLNRILYRGRSALANKNVEALFPLLRVSRPNIFNRDVYQAMYRGSLEQIRTSLDEMPNFSDLDLANYLDLWAIRTRLPNFDGLEQSRMDAILPSYMPFAQPSLLQHLFGLRPSRRQGGRLLKRMIKDYSPSLTKYPLVRNGIEHPFGLSPIAAWLWTKVRSRRSLDQSPTDTFAHLFILKEFVCDTIESSAVNECGIYDMDSIHNLVHKFYGGLYHLAPQLDWWLSFELWRQSIDKKTIPLNMDKKRQNESHRLNVNISQGT